MTGDLQRIVVLPDFQIPLHSVYLTTKFARFVHQYQPDAVAHVGDLTDSQQLGHWVEGKAEQFVPGGLEEGFQKTRDWLELLRSGYDGPFHLSRANHDDRLARKIDSKMPELQGFTVQGYTLSIENALQLDKYGVTYHHQPHEIAPGVLLMHGDETKKRSSIPGGTAYQNALAMGMCVVHGHTHKAGIIHTPRNSRYKRELLWGMEVGHAMDAGLATYLGVSGVNTWQNAFGILYVERKEKRRTVVHPQLVTINNRGGFVVEGRLY